MAKRKKKWIQRAIKRPGRLTRLCKRRGYSKATCACARSLAKSSNKSVRGAAILGMRLMGCGGVKGKIRKKRKKRK